MFHYINIELIRNNLSEFQNQWNSKKPFKYLYFDDFFFKEKAELIYSSFPLPNSKEWNNTTYINQKNKFQKTQFEENSIFNQVFSELNSLEFLTLLTKITGIPNLISDEKLFGGGLHQSVKGAFLDVHVDYNFHPITKNHRMLNTLVYMNKDWKDEYEGYLELWDMDEKIMIEKISPNFNRLAMFETNEISFHGHPHPLNTPEGVNRQSIATYYYTENRNESETSEEHNTIYVNTTGVAGRFKNLKSGIKAIKERFQKK